MRHYISFSGRGGRHYFQPHQESRKLNSPAAVDFSEPGEETAHCSGCRRQCPLTAPGCEKGRDFFRG
jgi:hypothetical protein